MIDQAIASGKSVPSFLKGYENPADRPPKDYAWQSYAEAYQRLSWQRPIPFSEMKLYHESFEVPYPLGVFVDAMRTLEYDELNQRKKNADKQAEG